MGNYEYHMTKESVKSILNSCKKEKGSKQDKLCKYVNSFYGIKGNCIRVIEQ